METEVFSALAEFGSTGMLLGLLWFERRRSTEIVDARISDLKERIRVLESLIPPTLAQKLGLS